MENTGLQTIEVKPLATFETSKADLITFVSDYQNLIVTPETFEDAKKARATIREKRYDIQRIEKSNNDQLNDLKTQNKNNAAELLEILLPIENSIDAGIKTIEQKKAAEKAEKERLEREKVAAELKAEQDRLAKIEQDRLAEIAVEQEKERLRLAELQKEIDAKNKIEEERLAAIKAEQEKERKVQQEKEDAIKAEREKFEAEKRAHEAKLKAEADAKQREIDLQKAREEAAKKATIEAAAKAEHEKQEAIAEMERKQKESTEKAEMERLAAIEADLGKADKAKFNTIVSDLTALKTKYEFKSKKHNTLSSQVNGLIDKIIIHIQEKA